MNPHKLPFLTIGLPFYNNSATLEKAVNSVLIQSYKNWELILINDGSTDDSLLIAQKLMEKDSRVSLLDDGENKGLVSRLNQIIDIAKGDYVARMDADDMMMPEKIQTQMVVLINNPRIDVIDTAAYTINEKDEPVGIRGFEVLNTHDKKKALKSVLLFHPTIIVKTSWYRSNKYSQDFVRSEDYELWCRTFGNTVFHRITEPHFLYREGNVNVKNYVTSMRTSRKVLRLYSPGVLSKTEFFVEMLKTYLKSATYKVFALFNMQHILTSKRNQKLTPGQQAEIKQVINRIKTAGEIIPEGVMHR